MAKLTVNTDTMLQPFIANRRSRSANRTTLHPPISITSCTPWSLLVNPLCPSTKLQRLGLPDKNSPEVQQLLRILGRDI